MNGREFDFFIAALPWVLAFFGALCAGELTYLLCRVVGGFIADTLRYRRAAREYARTARSIPVVRLKWRRREDYIRIRRK